MDISPATSAFSVALSIAKSLVDIRDGQLFKEKVSELTDAILRAQSYALDFSERYAAADKRARDLEKKVVELDDWTKEKARYELEAILPGKFVYASKMGMGDSEPPHYICATCYNLRVKSPLQEEFYFEGHAKVLFCPICATELYIKGHRHQGHPKRAPFRIPER